MKNKCAAVRMMMAMTGLFVSVQLLGQDFEREIKYYSDSNILNLCKPKVNLKLYTPGELSSANAVKKGIFSETGKYMTLNSTIVKERALFKTQSDELGNEKFKLQKDNAANESQINALFKENDDIRLRMIKMVNEYIKTHPTQESRPSGSIVIPTTPSDKEIKKTEAKSLPTRPILRSVVLDKERIIAERELLKTPDYLKLDTRIKTITVEKKKLMDIRRSLATQISDNDKKYVSLAKDFRLKFDPLLVEQGKLEESIRMGYSMYCNVWGNVQKRIKSIVPKYIK